MDTRRLLILALAGLGLSGCDSSADAVDYIVDGALPTYNTASVVGAASGAPQAFSRVQTGFNYRGPDGQVVAASAWSEDAGRPNDEPASSSVPSSASSSVPSPVRERTAAVPNAAPMASSAATVLPSPDLAARLLSQLAPSAIPQWKLTTQPERLVVVFRTVTVPVLDSQSALGPSDGDPRRAPDVVDQPPAVTAAVTVRGAVVRGAVLLIVVLGGQALRKPGLLAAALSLAGCGATPHNPDTAGASGVTVYGTADAGIGRVRK